MKNLAPASRQRPALRRRRVLLERSGKAFASWLFFSTGRFKPPDMYRSLSFSEFVGERERRPPPAPKREQWAEIMKGRPGSA
ncbi:hypothetical protein EVAR_86270_1 [Eumeta japonica]|uniref:Uncharacterized protein n=1 Tax=Eumeta variegata TaxID=151549 RepID=A0A4C1UBN8_EUMVA|nr:hypothetical protein EVAR_86270_1 [Eumeta japonica]